MPMATDSLFTRLAPVLNVSDLAAEPQRLSPGPRRSVRVSARRQSGPTTSVGSATRWPLGQELVRGRADRRAEHPDGLRAAWAVLERTWAATLERAVAMPDGTVDVSVDGEWSFAQALRHLVLATDMWLGRAILEIEQPFHPIGQADTGTDISILTKVTPSYAEVLEVRAGRVAMMRDFLATVTPEVLAETRKNPHAPEHPETVLSCLHVILEEEWEHNRYAVRDLDAKPDA